MEVVGVQKIDSFLGLFDENELIFVDDKRKSQQTFIDASSLEEFLFNSSLETIRESNFDISPEILEEMYLNEINKIIVNDSLAKKIYDYYKGKSIMDFLSKINDFYRRLTSESFFPGHVISMSTEKNSSISKTGYECIFCSDIYQRGRECVIFDPLFYDFTERKTYVLDKGLKSCPNCRHLFPRNISELEIMQNNMDIAYDNKNDSLFNKDFDYFEFYRKMNGGFDFIEIKDRKKKEGISKEMYALGSNIVIESFFGNKLCPLRRNINPNVLVDHFISIKNGMYKYGMYNFGINKTLRIAYKRFGRDGSSFYLSRHPKLSFKDALPINVLHDIEKISRQNLLNYLKSQPWALSASEVIAIMFANNDFSHDILIQKKNNIIGFVLNLKKVLIDKVYIYEDFDIHNLESDDNNFFANATSIDDSNINISTELKSLIEKECQEFLISLSLIEETAKRVRLI